jgi:hypothetical protein
VIVSLFETLHGAKEVESPLSPLPSTPNSAISEDLSSPRVTRQRIKFFTFWFTFILIYQFLPSTIMPTLTSISLICIFSPIKTQLIKNIGSGYTGFGIGNFSLDWTVIGGAAGLYSPFFSTCCFFLGFAAELWVVIPLLYYFNVWDAQKFDKKPIGAELYTENFTRFDIKTVINQTTLVLDEERWKQVGSVSLTPGFAMS